MTDHLSNWYVRLCRRRFWKSEGEGITREDKIAAYQTLEEALAKTAALMAPIAPFISERIMRVIFFPLFLFSVFIGIQYNFIFMVLQKGF